MTRLKLWTLLTLVLCGLELSTQAQESADFKKNTIFLGVSMFHYAETGGLRASFNWWIMPDITYQRTLNSKSKLSASFVEFSDGYNFMLNQIFARSTETYSIQYGRKIFNIENLSVYVNSGVAVRHLSEVWLVAVIGGPGWGELITDSYYEWGVGAAFRLDLHYTIKDRINLNPHIDYQHYFDGRAPQFFVGFQVGYNFGK